MTTAPTQPGSAAKQAPAGRLPPLPPGFPTGLARRLVVWRSPREQPRWARPALLAIAALAALAYGWGANEAPLEPYYAAAARSMAGSWHDFLFGAFDPAGTLSVDKIPGALWLQALSLRLFSFHIWAIVLPQAIEGVIAVLVLYRLSRRLAGPVAGIAAAAVLAVNPASVALNRGNVSDSLYVMLTVLAADAAVRATIAGRLRVLLLAGLWVGLAFQAKMLQAWLIAPALAALYLTAAPPQSMRVRLRHVALAGLLCVVVSLSWMSVVSLVPASQRPYADGTQNDSLFSQVFEYNGISRVASSSSLAGAGHRAAFFHENGNVTVAGGFAGGVSPSWHRLLSGLYGRDIGWLLPAALIAAAAIAIARRGHGRRDPIRAAVVLWGTWLLLLWVAFSKGVYLHAYYVAALAPALAGLCGTGAALAWPRRQERRVRAILAGTLLVTLAYGVYLLDGGVDVPGWIIPAAILATVVATLILLGPLLAPARLGGNAALRDAAAIAAMLVLPAIVSVLFVTRSLGPFVTPFEARSAMPTPAQDAQGRQQDEATVETLESQYQTPIVFAIDTARLAARYVYATGKEILPLGGFEGGIPTPTVAQLSRYVSSGELRAVLAPKAEETPQIAWVHHHCRSTGTETHGSYHLVLYDCGA